MITTNKKAIANTSAIGKGKIDTDIGAHSGRSINTSTKPARGIGAVCTDFQNDVTYNVEHLPHRARAGFEGVWQLPHGERYFGQFAAFRGINWL